jgi:F-type H+-transporting ATPase subunit gamma
MSGLKEIRTRIGSVKTTRQVTNAMKMVSASKLKKAQDVLSTYRPYARKLFDIAATVIPGIEEMTDSVYTYPREANNVLVILISSNRGLCGGFNSKIAGAAIELVSSKYTEQLKKKQVHFLAIGKHGERFLKSHKMIVAGNKHELFDQLTDETAAGIVTEILNNYQNGVYDRVELVYNEFVTAAQYIQKKEVFLPLQLPKKNKNVNSDNIIFEPSREEITEKIIPMMLNSIIYKALLVSSAAEHGARMTAMHQATDNATELISELTLQYNKERQAAITKEILEITGGAEAQLKH